MPLLSMGRTLDDVWNLTMPEVGTLIAADKLTLTRNQDLLVTQSWLTANYGNARKLPELAHELPSLRSQRAAERAALAAEYTPERVLEMISADWGGKVSPDALDELRKVA